ncbi:hypothetical protein [Paraburkholderia sp.]|uniref:hypothetical protein n=1 Tax=Paraburkholderia sp. TaxID=1926495 RepID=UPI003978FD93
MQRLVAQKLEVAAEELRAEGWGWTETRVERDLLELNRYGKLRPIQRPFTDDEQREMDALTAQQDNLAEKLEALPKDDENAYQEADRLEAEIGHVIAEIVALESRALVWDTQQMAEAGAFVIIDPQGKLLIERGLVRRENSAALDAAGATVTGTPEAQAADPADGPVPKIKPVHSAKLCQRLTAHRTVAVHAEMVAQPAVALAALLRHLVPQALPEHYGYTSAPDYLALSGDNNHESLLRAADDLPTCPAWNAIEAQRARWVAELPAKRADLLPWLAKQDPGTTLLDLLAFCTGTLLDGIAGEEKPQAISALAGALNLDMTRYWTPTRATYFDHVSKARIGEVVSAAVSPKVAADLGKMKKADAAAAAELRLAKVAWLPEILTDTEIPVTPSWEAHDDEDGNAGADEHDTDTGNGSDDAQDDGSAGEPESDHDGISNTVCDVAASPATAGVPPPWPFPTAAGLARAS